MKKELAEALFDACDNNGINADIREDYSGRGMYGKVTCGIVVDSVADVLSCLVNNADLFVGENGERLFADCNFRTDSMGRGTIIY